MHDKKVILGVGAHADDMDFGASGSIRKLIEEGWEAYYVIATDGSRGSADPDMTHEKLKEIRQQEQLNAGKVLGLKDIFFLNHVDTQLVSDLTLKEEIVKVIRTVRPNVVISLDPTFYYYAGPEFSFINHTDHRAVSLAAMDSVFPMSRDRLTFPEHEKVGLMPWKVEELWFINFTTPNEVVDISSVWDKKVEVLKQHQSQFKDVEGFINVMKQRANFFAKGKGYEYAENFTKLKISF